MIPGKGGVATVAYGKNALRAIAINPNEDIWLAGFATADESSGQGLMTNKQKQQKKFFFGFHKAGDQPSAGIRQIAIVVLSRRGQSGQVRVTARFDNDQEKSVSVELKEGAGADNTFVSIAAADNKTIRQLHIDGPEFSGEYVLLDDLAFVTRDEPTTAKDIAGRELPAEEPEKFTTSLLTSNSLSHRALLRGAGAAMALPWLNAMQPVFASATNDPPKRFAWVYIPNGVVQEAWHPKTAGGDWEVTPTLEPLAPFRDKLNLFTGLDREFRGGTGVHAQAGCCWLTSSPPTEALDGGFPTNISLDQQIAKQIAGDTLLPSLELSCNDHTNQKETKYFETISWYGPGYAANVQKDPGQVFQRLFGKPPPP